MTSSEVLAAPAVRLTYLDCGNVFIQLVEPLDETSPVAEALARQGEGLHHICFAFDDALAAASQLADPGSGLPVPGHGRGRLSAFVPGHPHHGVLVECTDVDVAGA